MEQSLPSVTQLRGPSQLHSEKEGFFPQLIHVNGVGRRGSQDEKMQH